MSDPAADVRAVWWFIGGLLVIELLFAASNLPLIEVDRAANRAWAAGAAAHPAGTEAEGHGEHAAPLVPPRFSAGREIRHFLKQQLDLDRECNVTTWFAAAQLALMGFVALALATRTGIAGWFMIGLGLFYLSADESAQIHEWLGTQITHSGWRIGALDPPYPWIVVLGPLFVGFGAWMVGFLARQFAREPGLRLLGVGGVVCMAASLPLEVLGGQIQGKAPFPPRIEVIAEETLENVGATLLFAVLLLLLGRALAPPACEGAARER